MKKLSWLKHVGGVVGLGALQAAQVAHPFLPFPFNLAVVAGLAIAQGVITHQALKVDPKKE